VNARGEMRISPGYESATSFHAERAVVGRDGRYGVIDRSGQLVVPMEYDWIEGYEHGPSRVRKNGRTGTMSVNGEVLLEAKYDHVGAYHDGLALVVEAGRCGYADTLGRMIIALDYEAPADVATWGDVSNGRAEVRSGGKHGIIGVNNERIVPFQYADVGGTHGPLFAVKKKTKWGFVDMRGANVVEAKYDQVWDFVEGVARVQVGGLFGAVDSTGKEVITPTLSTLVDARAGHLVGGSGRSGVFDKTGKPVLPMIHQEIVLITERIAKVTDGGRFAYRDLSDGRYLWKEVGYVEGGSTE
jgi:hypothetical protein